jgi:LAO/AO transport system kinase
MGVAYLCYVDTKSPSDLFESKDPRKLARSISFIENGLAEGLELLKALPQVHKTPVVGFTGPPGAGKSTLINAYTQFLVNQGKHIAILAVDPTSPFSKGSLLGDRIRMSQHYLHPHVFIRSMAGRGSLGGLSPKIFEVTDLLRAAWFDYIFIETVGVGQSEVEIAGLADTTVLVLVPESGDEVQTLKSGIMEIADVFVVNKSDRAGAATFYKNIVSLVHAHATPDWECPVVKTIASLNDGIPLLNNAIIKHQNSKHKEEKKIHILTEKALQLIKEMRTHDIKPEKLQQALLQALKSPSFNLYSFATTYNAHS